MQRVRDTVGVLREGRLLYQGSLDELLIGSVTPAYLVRVREPAEPVVAALRGEAWVKAVEDEGHGELRVAVSSVADAESRLVGVLARTGARVVSLEPAAADLESVFLELTS